VAFAWLVSWVFGAGIVKITQRYILDKLKIEAQLEEARLAERQVNGRSIDDLQLEAKAAERLARARKREADALTTIAEQKALGAAGEDS
jgi:hypothetical protein